jgi:hypothetical protein
MERCLGNLLPRQISVSLAPPLFSYFHQHPDAFAKKANTYMNAMGISKLIITRYTADAGSTNY